MGHPGWELAGRETGRGIYHRRWDIQDGNWQVGRRGRGIYHRRWDIQDGNWQVGTGKRNFEHDMGLPRAQLEDFDPAMGDGEFNPDMKHNGGSL